MAMATPYTQVLSFPPYKSLPSFFIPIILTLILVVRNKQAFKFTKSILYFGSAIIIWIFFQYIKYAEFYPMTLFLIYNVIMAYVFVSIYGYRIFILYEQYITFFAVISLFFWVIYGIAPSLMDNIFSYMNLIDFVGTSKSNILIYGVATSSDILGIRNLGFTQEPGFFSVFLIIAIYFNVIINRFVLIGNNNLYILVLALLTTQSTTGYISLFSIVLLYFLQKSIAAKSLIIIIMICLVPIIISLPFIGEKLNTYMYSESSIETAATNSEYQANLNSVYVPQRIDGVVFEFLNFLDDPLLGYGMDFKTNSYVGSNIGDSISISNGNIRVFSKFGIFIGILYFMGVYNTGRLLVPYNPRVGGYSFLLMFIILSFSYDLIHVPLLLSIWLFAFFKTNNVPVRSIYIKYVSQNQLLKFNYVGNGKKG
jgi:hypothetical protein